jgi:hypothetical protein
MELQCWVNRLARSSPAQHASAHRRHHSAAEALNSCCTVMGDSKGMPGENQQLLTGPMHRQHHTKQTVNTKTPAWLHSMCARQRYAHPAPLLPLPALTWGRVGALEWGWGCLPLSPPGLHPACPAQAFGLWLHLALHCTGNIHATPLGGCCCNMSMSLPVAVAPCEQNTCQGTLMQHGVLSLLHEAWEGLAWLLMQAPLTHPQSRMSLCAMHSPSAVRLAWSAFP